MGELGLAVHERGSASELARLRERVWIQLVACVEAARPLHLAYRLAAPLARVVEENRAAAADGRVAVMRGDDVAPWLRARVDVLVAAHVGLARVRGYLARLGTADVVAARELPDYPTARAFRAAEMFVSAAARSHLVEAAQRMIAEGEAQLVAVDVFVGWRA